VVRAGSPRQRKMLLLVAVSRALRGEQCSCRERTLVVVTPRVVGQGGQQQLLLLMLMLLLLLLLLLLRLLLRRVAQGPVQWDGSPRQREVLLMRLLAAVLMDQQEEQCHC